MVTCSPSLCLHPPGHRAGLVARRPGCFPPEIIIIIIIIVIIIVSPLSTQEHAVQAPGRRPARQLHPAVPPEKFKNYRFCLENFDKILKIRQFLSSLKSKSQFPHLYVVKLFILAFIKYFG